MARIDTNVRPKTEAKGSTGSVTVRGFVRTQETAQAWVGAARYRTSDSMYRTDPVVRAAVLMVVLPIIEAEWTVDPGGEDPDDLAKAELVRRALLEHLDWPQVLWDLVSPAVRYGHSVLESTWEAVEWELQLGEGDTASTLPKRPYWVPASYAPRPGHTIWRWNIENDGELTSVVQLAPRLVDVPGVAVGGPLGDYGQGSTAEYVPVELMADEILHWINERDGDELLGTSMLRCMWRAWFTKDKLEIIDAMRAEKAGMGVPVGWSGENEDEAAELETALANLRSGEETALVLKGSKDQPGAQHAEMMDMRAASTADVQASLHYHVTQILWGVLGAWQQLGQGEVGARATATVQDDPFYLLLGALANRVASRFNRTQVPKIVGYNLPGDVMPQLQIGTLQGVDITSVAEAISKLMLAGAITSDDDLEAHLRRIMGLPEQSAAEAGLPTVIDERFGGAAAADDPNVDTTPVPSSDVTTEPAGGNPTPGATTATPGGPPARSAPASVAVPAHTRKPPVRQRMAAALQAMVEASLDDAVTAALAGHGSHSHALARAQVETQLPGGGTFTSWRALTELEREHVLVGPIAGVIERQRQALQQQLEPVSVRLVEYLAGHLANSPEGAHLPPPPQQLRDDVQAGMARVLADTAAFGRATVRSELESQRGSARSMSEATIEAARHALAARPPRDPEKLDAWLERRAATATRQFLQRVEGEAERIAVRSGTVERTTALAGLTRSAGLALRAQAVATVAQALNAGRRAEAEQAQADGRVAGAEYSAVMDVNSCDPCASLDGNSYQVGSAEYEQDYPPLYACDGADACRCMMVIVAADETRGRP